MILETSMITEVSASFCAVSLFSFLCLCFCQRLSLSVSLRLLTDNMTSLSVPVSAESGKSLGIKSGPLGPSVIGAHD